MKRWEDAVDQFIVPWKRRRDVIGAVVAGSYVTGKPNPHSDLDIYIVTKTGTKWRERGNVRVDGFLVEYFVNPPEQIRKYFADNHATNSAMSLTPYTTGRILFDRDGTVKKLRVEAQRLLRKALPRKPRSERLLDAYRLWDGLDNLEDAVERNAPDAAFVYHHALARLFEIYAKHHRQVVPGVPKLYALLTSERARRKYNHPPFPDKKFASMFAQAVAESDPKGMAQCLGKLTKHVHDKWGGFEIDGFRVRMPIERGAKR